MTWVVARGERSVTVVALSSRCLCRLRRGTPRCSAGCRWRRLTWLPGDVESACARSARNQEAQAGSCCCGGRKGSAQKRWLKAYGRRAAPSRGESSGWSGFIRGSRARALQTMSCVWRVACTERRGLADIVVDVVRRPSGARGCHQIGAAVHQRYRARYVWPRCSPAGGGHSDLYMYKRETMILREDFRIRGYRRFTGGHSGTGARSEGSGRRGRWRATRWSVTTAARLLESRTAGCGLRRGIRRRRGEVRQVEQSRPRSG